MTELATPRLRLRSLGPDDEAFYCRLYTDPVLMRYVGTALSQETAERSFRSDCRTETEARRRWVWVMSERISGADLGLLGLTGTGEAAEIGALIVADRQNEGFAAEAIAALVDHAFGALELPMLATRHASANGSAGGLMRKLGFLPAAAEPGAALDCVWRLPRDRWRKSRAADG